VVHATHTNGLADVLELVLDRGLVITGDIKVKLVNVELLTIQVRLLIASVDKAKEMGMDWWLRNPDFTSRPLQHDPEELAELRQRVAVLEEAATGERS